MEGNLMGFKRENGEVICEQVKLASSIDERMIGLMFKKDMTEYKGLLISPCNSIHTFFMRMNIDVIFLDKDNKVLKVFYDMKPWRLTRIYFRARKVLEMKSGTLVKNLVEGEVLREYV